MRHRWWTGAGVGIDYIRGPGNPSLRRGREGIQLVGHGLLTGPPNGETGWGTNSRRTSKDELLGALPPSMPACSRDVIPKEGIPSSLQIAALSRLGRPPRGAVSAEVGIRYPGPSLTFKPGCVMRTAPSLAKVVPSHRKGGKWGKIDEIRAKTCGILSVYNCIQRSGIRTNRGCFFVGERKVEHLKR